MSRAVVATTALAGAANSVNANINSLIGDTAWQSRALTFSFPTLSSQYTGYGANDEPSRLTPAEAPYKAAVMAAFQAVAEFTNLTFTEVAPSAQTVTNIRFGVTADPEPIPGQPTKPDFAGWAYLPSQNENSGDTWIKNNQRINEPFTTGDFRWFLIYHEIGHALGLVHPFEAGGIGTAGLMDPTKDSNEYTVMAYRSSVTSGNRTQASSPENGGSAQTWMQYDVAALQAVYGANYQTRSGNTTYTWSPTTGQMSVDGVAQGTVPTINRIFMNVWDGGGTDTYDFSNYTSNVTVDLAPGAWSTPSIEQVAITNPLATGAESRAPGAISNSLLWNGDLRAIIENAKGGSGNDTLAGNAVANRLTGAGGNDTIDGREGTDYAVFSGQRAGYLIEAQTAGRVVTDQTGGRDGTDTLINIERLQFSDGILAFDTAGIAGQVYRLYQAAFARTPDTAGLSHNIKLVDGGLSLQQMSSAFIGSAEFQQKYGTNVTDTAYINAMYRNVLGRDADQAGLDGWQGRLNDGSWTRTTLLIGFSESPENINLLANQIANGIWIV